MKKKNIFKCIALALCATLCLPCFACGDSKKDDVQESAPTVTTVAGEYLYHGGVSEYSIVIRNDANYYESFAATELANNLQKAIAIRNEHLKESKVYKYNLRARELI